MSASPSKTVLSMQRGLVAGLIASVIFTAVSGAVMVLAFAHVSDRTAGLWLGAPAIVSLCFGLLVAFSAVLRREQRPAMRGAMMVGVGLTPLATALVLTVLIMRRKWFFGLDEETLASLGTAAFAIAIALAYTGALALVRSRSWLIRALAVGTGVSAWGAGGLLIIILLAEGLTRDFDILILLAVTLGILILLLLTGTIAVPIAMVSKASKRREAVESIDARVQVHFGCPKCGERQSQRPGFVKCRGCGAGMFIEIEEPRCECGYLLYQLTGNTCPECGRAVMNRGNAHDG